MINIDELRSNLKKIDKITEEEWMNSLCERKKVELAFHDRDRDRFALQCIDQDTYERFYSNKKYYMGTELSRSYLDQWIKTHARGKIFLDYACGNGGNALKAAKAEAALAIGIDISSVSIKNAKKDAANQGVSKNSFFLQADAENTKLPDNCVDVIVCTGMLHHLDLTCAFSEMQRILTPGGTVLAVESLSYNPLIKLYRSITPQMRTDWEKSHILSMKEIEYAKRYFELGVIRYWHITSILAPYAMNFLPFLNKLDRILTRLPIVQLLAWIFTFELIKQPA